MCHLPAAQQGILSELNGRRNEQVLRLVSSPPRHLQSACSQREEGSRRTARASFVVGRRKRRKGCPATAQYNPPVCTVPDVG
jgi:hypothetical protein